MVVVTPALAIVGALAAAPPALPQTSPADPIVAALQQSPVYVDPSLTAALPATQQQQLAAAINGGKVPIFVVLVPMVRGDAWDGKPESLATVVHDRIGKDGAYVTLSQDANDDLSAYEWPTQQHEARHAAWATNFEDHLRDAGLYPKVARAIALIQSGEGRAAYDAAIDRMNSRYPGSGGSGSSGSGSRGSGSSEDRDGSAPGWLAPILALTLLGGAGAAVAAGRNRRRRPRFRGSDSFRLPRKVFVAAQRANEVELRNRASAELLAFGELLDHEDFKPEDPEAQADLQRALDAYLAAGKVADAGSRAVDWVGVLVLVDAGRDAYAAARARDAGERATPPSALCFFNPLHGDSARTVNWRPIGQRPRLHVPACPACATAVKERRAPEVLTDRSDGHDVPYFEAAPDQSLWAATGYGTLRKDLIPSILRGDFTRTTPPG